MKKTIAMLMLACFALPLFAAEEAKVEDKAAAGDTMITVPTVAVLHFEERGAKSKDEGVGSSVADLLTVKLIESGKFDVVERAEINKILDELQLSGSGLVKPETQVKVGHMIGAKIMIAGSIIRAGKTNYVVAKAIGTETSRVVGVSVNGAAEPTELVPQVAEKLVKQLEENIEKLLPEEITTQSVIELLAPKVKGEKRKVYVEVKEDIAVTVKDPAVETELKKLLLALGFELAAKADAADFAIIGEGQAVQSNSYRQFLSAAAVVELTLSQGDQVLAVDRQEETLAGSNYQLTAKNALAQAALKLASKMFLQIPAK